MKKTAVQASAETPVGAPIRIGLALGGGGARGLAHIHVLGAFDDLGLKPSSIAGSSIGALLGAAYASGMSAAEIGEYAADHLGRGRLVLGHLWRSRASSLSQFFADGGVRFGQLNAERILEEFLPIGMTRRFEELRIPTTVTATHFYGGACSAIREGDLVSALAASIALPAIFRPVRREGAILVDGGICNPLPYDLLGAGCDVQVACDVTGPPEPREGDNAPVPTPIDAMLGSSQLMMNAIIETKRRHQPPDFLIRPPVAQFRVLDFLQVGTILEDTRAVREKTKRGLDALIALHEVSRS